VTLQWLLDVLSRDPGTLAAVSGETEDRAAAHLSGWLWALERHLDAAELDDDEARWFVQAMHEDLRMRNRWAVMLAGALAAG
jgi:hypothetical protein